jgi:para-aminobenzoate synthetase component 1
MHFASPIELIYADTLSEVPAAFAQLQAAHESGKWLAGLAGYELGYAFINKLKHLLPSDRQLPLLAFGVFDGYCLAPEPLDVPVNLSPPVPLWNFEEYKAAFESVHEYIKAGDIYQANLTFPMTAQFDGPFEALYARLQSRQKVTHGALLDLGSIKPLSRSPELFFKLTKNGVLTTRPMKGTAPRGIDNITDKALRDDLAASEKNRAENLMIVDLLRNDMSIVSEVGSVTVPEIFTIEEYATLFQMTSRITSQLRRNTSLYDLFAALFPCGSITGAPKIRAMEILGDLEPNARDAYCGSIGWIGPDGAMEFNVAIRTLVCDQSTGTARINVGGGIVYDSTAEDEYAEALLKSKFAQLSPQI